MVDSLILNTPIAIGVFLFVVLILLLIIKQSSNKLAKALIEERQARSEVQSRLDQTNKQLLELRSIVVGLSQKATEQEDVILLLNERIVELEQEDTDSRLYSRATKLVQLGADIDEVINECELPKAEAELMYSLQQKLSGNQKVPPLTSHPDRMDETASKRQGTRKNTRG